MAITTPVMHESIELHEVEDGAVAYNPATDQVHFLNYTARCVLLLCDGHRRASAMDVDLADMCGAEPVDGLTAPILEQFAAAGLIEDVKSPAP